MKFQQAFKMVAAALKKDEGYRQAWQSNIAMAFVDTFRQQGCRDSYVKLHKVANDAAIYFLRLLVTTPGRPLIKFESAGTSANSESTKPRKRSKAA
jgi:hypothetical protein